MTTTTLSFSPDRRRSPRPATASTSAAPGQAATRREYRERDFGIGYGRSSGYASDKRYASDWTGALRFRCG